MKNKESHSVAVKSHEVETPLSRTTRCFLAYRIREEISISVTGMDFNLLMVKETL